MAIVSGFTAIDHGVIAPDASAHAPLSLTIKRWHSCAALAQGLPMKARTWFINPSVANELLNSVPEGGNRTLAASAKALCQNCKSGHSSRSTSKPPCCAVRQGPLCAGSSQCIVANCSCPLGRDRPRLSRGGASYLQFNHLRFDASVGVNSRFFASRSDLHHHIHTVGSLPEVAIERISGVPSLHFRQRKPPSRHPMRC